jgi:hypothetical protein
MNEPGRARTQPRSPLSVPNSSKPDAGHMVFWGNPAVALATVRGAIVRPAS